MPVKILDPSVSSKIAAGEVVEGPGSVVKELVENSIDAGADFISVYTENGGKNLIRVTDNGCGMSEDDLKLCLYRYSTSKINSFNDLLNLSSYGYRGEALFSIFSVSHITILSYNGTGETGFMLKASGGDFSTITLLPSQPVKGTTVEVRDLFFNLPARLKFLKSERALNSSITRIFETVSLIKPDIRFKLTIDGSTVYDLAKTEKHIKRIEEITQINQNDIIEHEEKFDYLSIKLFISKPEKFTHTRNNGYIYINSRPVESKLISNSIYKASQEIEQKAYPFYLIIINIDPSMIDVNVHPQKKEVRFKDENFIYSAVFKTVKTALENQIKKSKSEVFNQPQQPVNIDFVSEEQSVKPDVFTEQNFIDSMFENHQKNTPSFQMPRFIGQAFSSILIFETSNSILFIDQHAAAERITYERYIEEYESKKIQKQNLLNPVTINLSASYIEKLMEMQNWLAESGFEINRTSANSISVYSYPAVFDLTENDIKDLIIYLLDVISKPSSISYEIKRDALATRACKSSLKFNEFISPQKASGIFENLMKTKDPFRCPHGRPTTLEISKEELAKKFSRTPREL